jgi:hypothetical protein
MSRTRDPSRATAPTVTAVLAFEALPLGRRGSRRAIVRWSDGTQGEALRWFDDEIAVREADLLGRAADEIRRLHFGGDRAFLRAPGPFGG